VRPAEAFLAQILDDAPQPVVARCGDADDLLRRTLAHRPDVMTVDVRMPPAARTTGSARPSRSAGASPGSGS